MAALSCFCRAACRRLVARHIQHLELECIGTRYLLSQHMDKEQGDLLCIDILENLGRRHYDSPTYQLFKEFQYSGGDPMEFRNYLIKVQKQRIGEPTKRKYL